ncbi:hypothetical protein EYF80_045092 [Liparis tanakae]|uniref:Uncharacterized protein n=1 Tax=Liparis tanakae TaxID=230148 RepID=A0A4Z2FUZ4_9TELE|nr:hypothetical protein EYF80_045092 [Liparis tanakae]
MVRKGDNKSTLTLTSAGRLETHTCCPGARNPPESRTAWRRVTGHRPRPRPRHRTPRGAGLPTGVQSGVPSII